MTGAIGLRMLGGYEGTCGPGHLLALPTKKAWALFAYLALHSSRELKRERLAALLWGDRFDEQARRSLRQELYEIRNALGESLADRLTATRDTVVFDGDGLEVDVLRFEDLAGREDAESLEAAEALYRGPLLDGLDISESAFEAWLGAERARLHEVACRTLERLTAYRLDDGSAEAAIETARRLLLLDPLREEAHRLLLRGLAKAGRRSEALKHYQELEALLQSELAAEPEAETLRLRDVIREGAEQPVEDRPEYASPAARPSRKTWLWAVAVALVAMVAATAGYFLLRGPETVGERASEARMAYPLPDKPSIAVLPFDTFSGEERDSFIAKGLTEDIITALSSVPQLFVISRTSSFAFKDKSVSATEIAEELGVRYILEGSIQRSGDMLRINAQLVDAIGGHHLWADNFDGEAKDLFALQDDIVRRILVELQVKLTGGDHARVASRGTTNLDAWLLRMQAMAELYKFTRESTVRTRELLQKAHEADPGWSRPLGGLAWSYWWEAKKGWTDDREGWIRKGIELAEQAIEMDPNDTLGYMQLGNLYQLKGDHEPAIALREKAVRIAPNDFQANWGLGSVLIAAGQPERGVEHLKRAERLAPRHPASLTWTLAQGQLFAGHYEDAIESANQAAARVPNRSLPHVQLTAALTALGRMEEARGEAAEVLRIDPKFTVSGWKRQLTEYKDRAAVDLLASLLVQAGLPE